MLRIGQVGLGMWGANLFRNFCAIDNAKVVACCDRDKAKLEKAKAAYSHIKITQDAQDLMRDKNVDAVVIATPPSSHGRLAELALKNGKHVFVEKPVALKVKDAVKICAIAEKKRLTLMVGHLLLHHPAVRYLKEVIDSGEIGQVFYLYSTRVNLGQVRLEENALWSLAPHDISVAMYLLGQAPAEVAATGESYLQEDVEDVIFMTLKFKNGVILNTHVSWLDPHKIRKFTIVGSKKMVVFDDMEPAEKIRIYDKGIDERMGVREGSVSVPTLKLTEPLGLECRHFVDSVLNGTHPFTDGNNGVEVLRVLEAAQESLKKNGKPVKVKQDAQ